MNITRTLITGSFSIPESFSNPLYKDSEWQLYTVQVETLDFATSRRWIQMWKSSLSSTILYLVYILLICVLYLVLIRIIYSHERAVKSLQMNGVVQCSGARAPATYPVPVAVPRYAPERYNSIMCELSTIQRPPKYLPEDLNNRTFEFIFIGRICKYASPMLINAYSAKYLSDIPN